MKRVKEKWDQYYREYRDASWQKLGNNAARFKEPEVINLILMRRRNEIQEEETRHDEKPENREVRNRKVRNDISNNNNN